MTPVPVLDGDQTPDYPMGQSSAMNRTQNAFNTKENKLLEMFTDDEQGRGKAN